ncbi:hypothetical protein [Streptomyces sp. ITFR-6]|uniref:hypothetical protein n=1 Tax=Streptomyces sp. ITFR-6 TaxID=3075197 RepID=UPI00288B0317|nr:hypothetical protein [Streptomyces sp. ITFR-6]WNI28030.1 hypothetical protein RLT59_04010 [Streptomyces sp. ITFR-6]
MSVARRPLLTATAAGILLCALWFVPSARGGDDHHSTPHQQSTGYSRGVGSQQLALGDTDGVDATPYLIAGAAVLAAAAGYGVRVARRARPA